MIWHFLWCAVGRHFRFRSPLVAAEPFDGDVGGLRMRLPCLSLDEQPAAEAGEVADCFSARGASGGRGWCGSSSPPPGATQSTVAVP